MRCVHSGGKDYVLDDDGRVIIAVQRRRKPSVDPQLAILRARLVFDRTMADKTHGGRDLARFATEQHLQVHYLGRNRNYRLSPKAIRRIQAAIASW